VVLAAYDKYASGHGISHALILNFLRRRPTATFYIAIKFQKEVQFGIGGFKSLKTDEAPDAVSGASLYGRDSNRAQDIPCPIL